MTPELLHLFVNMPALLGKYETHIFCLLSDSRNKLSLKREPEAIIFSGYPKRFWVSLWTSRNTNKLFQISFGKFTFSAELDKRDFQLARALSEVYYSKCVEIALNDCLWDVYIQTLARPHHPLCWSSTQKFYVLYLQS